MIIGIDIGTQALKVVVTDEVLNVLGEASAGYETRYPRPGWAEQSPSQWEQALAQAMPKALAEANVKPRAIKALGVAGQLDGCLAVEHHGLPLTPCLVWMDRRATLGPNAPHPRILRRIAGINPDPSHQAAKIRWLIDHTPECEFACKFHQPVSYLVSRLTGEHVFDHGLASTTMLYSLEKREYDGELLESFGINPAKLPAIRDADTLAGKLTAAGASLTGLKPGVAVAVGTGDDFSSPLGAGLTRPDGTVACVLGTAEVVGAVHAVPRIDTKGLVETHGYMGGAWFIENPGWLSGGALTWLIKTCRLKDAKELSALAAQAPAGADGLLFLPALSGAMAPEWIATARGCFYGLTPAHDTARLARAVMEGCAFAMRDVVTRLRALRVPIDNALLLGGGARSAVWAQIRADITGMPIRRPKRVDTSPLGAAMLAAVAARILPDLQTGADLVRSRFLEHAPNPGNKSLYDDAYNSYHKLFNCLRPFY